VQAAAHVFEVALERRARDFQALGELGERDHATRAEQTVDGVEAFGPVHDQVILRGWRAL